MLDVGPSRTRVGVLYWNSDTAYLQYTLLQLSLVQDVMVAVRNVPYLSTRPNIAAALRLLLSNAFVTQNGDRPNVPNIVVMITNGMTALEQDAIFPAARNLRYNAITRIITISSDIWVNNWVINGLVNAAVGDNILWVQNINNLSTLLLPLLNITLIGWYFRHFCTIFTQFLFLNQLFKRYI